MSARPASLQTLRLLLRPLHPNDAPAIAALVDDAPFWIQRVQRSYAWYQTGPLAAICTDDGVLVGVAGLEVRDASGERDALGSEPLPPAQRAFAVVSHWRAGADPTLREEAERAVRDAGAPPGS